MSKDHIVKIALLLGKRHKTTQNTLADGDIVNVHRQLHKELYMSM